MRALIFLPITLALVFSLEAGVNSWTRIGPSEFLTDSFLIDPTDSNILYAAGMPGVLKSTDHGTSWTVAMPEITSILLMARHDAGVLYVWDGRGLKRSTDKGETWLSYPTPEGIIQLTVDPWNSDKLFAGSWGRMLKSADGGQSWEVMPGWTESGRFEMLTPHPLLKNVMFAAGDWGLSRTDDAGGTWKRLDKAGVVRRMAFHPTDPQYFYIAYGGAPRWTKDGGQTFLPKPEDVPHLISDIDAISVDPAQPNIVCFGGGDAFGSSVLFYRSSDAGLSWTRSDSGFEQAVVSALVPDHVASSMIWAATNAGIFRSLDRGVNWQSVTTGLMRGFDGPKSFAVQPGTGKLYAITGDSEYSWRLHISNDGGAIWRRTRWEYRAFATDATSSGTLYGATKTDFFKSTDSGVTWTKSSQPPQELDLILPVKQRPGLIYGAGQYSGGSFWRSTDGGQTWTNPAYEGFQGWMIWRLAVSPDGKTLYALTQLGLHKSVDEGLSWKACPPLPTTYDSYGSDVLLDSGDPNHLIVSTRKDGAYESFDGAQTLKRVDGLPDITTCLAGDFGTSSALYVGSDNGVFFSEDNGATWSLLNASIPERPINRVVPDPTNRRRIYASVAHNLLSYTRSPVGYLPRLSSKGGTIGFAAANLGADKVTITVTGFDVAGRPLSVPGGTNPVTIELSTGEQRARTDAEAFGAISGDLGDGWAQFDFSALGPGGMFSCFNGDLSLLDTWEMPASPARTFLFPEVGVGGFATLYFTNPGSEQAAIRATLLTTRGEVKAVSNVSLAAHGAAAPELAQLFAGTAMSLSDYVQVSSSRPFIAFQLFGRASKTVAGMGGLTSEHVSESVPERRYLYLPQFTVGNTLVRSVLGLINLGSEATWAYVQLYSEEGLLPYVGSVNIPPKSKITIDDRELFPQLLTPPLTAAVRIMSDVGGTIVGQVTFQDENREQFLTALPLLQDLGSSFILGHLASGSSFFTGIAMMNPAQDEVTVSLRVYSPAGVELAARTLKLPAEGRRSQLLTEYFSELQGKELMGGYVKVLANRPIACFGIYAPSNLSSFAMIPGQMQK